MTHRCAIPAAQRPLKWPLFSSVIRNSRNKIFFSSQHLEAHWLFYIPMTLILQNFHFPHTVFYMYCMILRINNKVFRHKALRS
jgi:hypothetical protein